MKNFKHIGSAFAVAVLMIFVGAQVSAYSQGRGKGRAHSDEANTANNGAKTGKQNHGNADGSNRDRKKQDSEVQTASDENENVAPINPGNVIGGPGRRT